PEVKPAIAVGADHALIIDRDGADWAGVEAGAGELLAGARVPEDRRAVAGAEPQLALPGLDRKAGQGRSVLVSQRPYEAQIGDAEGGELRVDDVELLAVGG